MNKFKRIKSFVAAVLMFCMIMMGYGNARAEEVQGATPGSLFTLQAYTLALNDCFELNYYMSVSDAVKNDASSYMRFTIDSQTQNVYPFQNAIGQTTYTCKVSAKQLRENIKAELYYNGSFYLVGNCSVKQYLETLISNEKYSFAADIAKAALNYGGYAQQYFNYNITSLANEGLYSAGQNPVELLSDNVTASKIKQKLAGTLSNDDLEYVGASIICDSGMGMRLYFKNKNSLSLSALKDRYNIYNKSKRLPFTVEAEGDFIYLELRDIPARDWDRDFNFQVEDKVKHNTLTLVRYSPIHYVDEAMNMDNVKLKNLCKAIYLYNVEAKAYITAMRLEEFSRFDVPYVSTYYFNPKPLTSDFIRIPLYITDFEQAEYMLNDTSRKLDLIYTVDDVEKRISDLSLGDHTLDIGYLAAGMHTFTLQTFDKRTGLKSAKLFNELWVVDTYDIANEAVYYMTVDDLKNYNIRNDDSTDPADTVNTRDGLTRLFADKQSAGFRKIVLYNDPNGSNIYRIDGKDARYNCITIPSYFTVDMNGCTFKMDMYSENVSGCIIYMNEAVDAHLENGILEGNRFERKVEGLETYTQGEAINTVLMKGGKYCSIDNMTIRNTTGHTVYSESVLRRDNAIAPYYVVDGYTNTAIIDGQEIPDTSCSTSKLMDLTQIINWDADEDYVYIGHKGGYRGIIGESRTIYVSFYDANSNFMETVVGCMYRKVGIPSGAKYARVTIKSSDMLESSNQVLNIYAVNLGDYHRLSNIKFENTRTCAIATTTCNNLLIENNTFDYCGNSITPLPVDFEDGWEECQDVYYRYNEVIHKGETSTGTIVDNAGYNHVYENCTNHQIAINGRLIGGVYKNMNDERNTLRLDMGSNLTNNFGRVCDNEKSGPIYAICQGGAEKAIDFKVKNSTIYYNNQVDSSLLAPGDKVVYENCKFPEFSCSKGTFYSCTIQPTGYFGDYLYFYDCEFKAPDGQAEASINCRSPYNGDRLFDNCRFTGKVVLNCIHAGMFRDCDFDDLRIVAYVNSSDWELIFDNCSIRSSAENFIYLGEFAYAADYINIQFIGCSITHTGENLINMLSLASTGSMLLFEECQISKSKGSLVAWDTNYVRAGNIDKIDVDIIFRYKVDSGNPATDINNLTVDNKTVSSVYARVTLQKVQ